MKNNIKYFLLLLLVSLNSYIYFNNLELPFVRLRLDAVSMLVCSFFVASATLIFLDGPKQSKVFKILNVVMVFFSVFITYVCITHTILGINDYYFKMGTSAIGAAFSTYLFIVPIPLILDANKRSTGKVVNFD